MIRLRGIRFNYNSRRLFDDLNFDLNKGDRVGLVGPNGSGKTTLCLIMMGLVKPEAGLVEIFGSPRTTEDDFAKVRGQLGYLFQDSDDQLFCPTVLEDVAFGPLNMGMSLAETKRLVARTLAALNLEGFEERITHQLSGGEKRLVSLATVLAMEPEALILDEPTTGLDEATTERIAEMLNKSGLTYLIISHDRDFLHKTTDHLIELRDGILKRL